MNSKFATGLLIAFCISATSCRSDRQTVLIEPPGTPSEEIKLPVQFATTKDLYLFIAKQEGITPCNEKTVFQLAADSATAILELEKPKTDTNLPPYLYVVESHFYNGGVFDQIRGAQGNGNYYLLRPLAKDFASGDTGHGFELVGLAGGNVYRLRYWNQTPIFETHWHAGGFADETNWDRYQWNGRYFGGVK